MSTTRVLSPSAAAALFSEELQKDVALRYATVFVGKRSELEPLLGTLVTYSQEEESADMDPTQNVNDVDDSFMDKLAWSLVSDSSSSLDSLDAFEGDEDDEDMLLVEGYAAGRGFVPVRIVDAPAEDQLVLEVAYAEFMSEMKDYTPSQGGLHLAGFLAKIVQESTHPLGRRMNATVVAMGALAQQIGRLELQKVLTDLGLGKINGLDMDALGALTGDQLAQILAGLRKAYASSVTSGALYYLVEKGTSKETFSAWYDQTCAQHGWGPENTDFAVHFLLDTGLTVTSDLLTEATADMAAFFVKHSHRVTDKDAARKLALRASHCAVSQALENIPTRSLAQLVADPSATDVEVAAGLRQAYQNGTPVSDPDAITLMRNLSQPYRISLIRAGGEEQDWFFRLLQNAASVAKAAK